MSQANETEHPVPVLQYDAAPSPQYDWMAKLICWFVAAHGSVLALELLIKFVPNQNEVERFWTDWPRAANGTLLVIFGMAGLGKFASARWGMVLCLIFAVLLNVALSVEFLAQQFTAGNYDSAFELLWCIGFALAPTFLVVCLVREPIRSFFRR